MSHEVMKQTILTAEKLMEGVQEDILAAKTTVALRVQELIGAQVQIKGLIDENSSLKEETHRLRRELDEKTLLLIQQERNYREELHGKTSSLSSDLKLCSDSSKHANERCEILQSTIVTLQSTVHDYEQRTRDLDALTAGLNSKSYLDIQEIAKLENDLKSSYSYISVLEQAKDEMINRLAVNSTTIAELNASSSATRSEMASKVIEANQRCLACQNKLSRYSAKLRRLDQLLSCQSLPPTTQSELEAIFGDI